MRISALHQDWLYEDKDVERIPASIERGVFEDIPRICDEVIGNLRALNERLTEIEESPTYESLRTEFQERGRQYREMLNMAGIALSRALTALASPVTRERFERWRSFRGIEDLEIEDALSHVEAVHHALHSLERHFVEFIKNIQSRRRAPLGVVRFQDVCHRLVYSEPSHDALLNLFADLGPWRARNVWFHPKDFVGHADLRAGRPEAQGVIFEEQAEETAQDRFQSFLERNRSWILARLRRGPVALSDLVTDGGLTFMDGESPASVFGVFSLPDELLNEDVNISVGLSGMRMDLRALSARRWRDMERQRTDLGFADTLDEFDPSEWQPKSATTANDKSPKAETKKAAAAAGFRSREPQPTMEARQTELPRRRRTGRSMQLNLKARPETIVAFCVIADSQGWGLGETLGHAVALLERESHSSSRLRRRVSILRAREHRSRRCRRVDRVSFARSLSCASRGFFLN